MSGIQALGWLWCKSTQGPCGSRDRAPQVLRPPAPTGHERPWQTLAFPRCPEACSTLLCGNPAGGKLLALPRAPGIDREAACVLLVSQRQRRPALYGVCHTSGPTPGPAACCWLSLGRGGAISSPGTGGLCGSEPEPRLPLRSRCALPPSPHPPGHRHRRAFGTRCWCLLNAP